MKPHLQFTRIWSDDDILELRVIACDGSSSFCVNVYVGVDWPDDMTKSLLVFRDHIHGGMFDLKAGEFGPEYASGALLARLHFEAPGRLLISTSLQSEYQRYKNTDVASEAKLYMKSEPVLLDRFISELPVLSSGDDATAVLECV